MRDPKRIHILLNKLEKLWKRKGEDLRFFQFIHNLQVAYGLPEDSFYVEDDKLLAILEKELADD